MTSCVVQGLSVFSPAARPERQGWRRSVHRPQNAEGRGAAAMASSSTGCDGLGGCVTSRNNSAGSARAVGREEEEVRRPAMGRRAALASSFVLSVFGSVAESAQAANDPVDPTTSPLVQGEPSPSTHLVCILF